jgi:hypothetical protein
LLVEATESILSCVAMSRSAATEVAAIVVSAFTRLRADALRRGRPERAVVPT